SSAGSRPRGFGGGEVKRSLFGFVRRCLSSSRTDNAGPVKGRAPSAAAWLIAAASALSLVACGEHSTGDAPSAHTSLATNVTERPFLDKIPEAPLTTVYGGTRHVHFTYKVND